MEDEFFETNRLQALPSERVSDRFNLMARALHEAHHKLNGDEDEVSDTWCVLKESHARLQLDASSESG